MCSSSHLGGRQTCGDVVDGRLKSNEPNNVKAMEIFLYNISTFLRIYIHMTDRPSTRRIMSRRLRMFRFRFDLMQLSSLPKSLVRILHHRACRTFSVPNLIFAVGSWGAGNEHRSKVYLDFPPLLSVTDSMVFGLEFSQIFAYVCMRSL